MFGLHSFPDQFHENGLAILRHDFPPINVRVCTCLSNEVDPAVDAILIIYILHFVYPWFPPPPPRDRHS